MLSRVGPADTATAAEGAAAAAGIEVWPQRALQRVHEALQLTYLPNLKDDLNEKHVVAS